MGEEVQPSIGAFLHGNDRILVFYFWLPNAQQLCSLEADNVFPDLRPDAAGASCGNASNLLIREPVRRNEPLKAVVGVTHQVLVGPDPERTLVVLRQRCNRIIRQLGRVEAVKYRETYSVK